MGVGDGAGDASATVVAARAWDPKVTKSATSAVAEMRRVIIAVLAALDNGVLPFPVAACKLMICVKERHNSASHLIASGTSYV